MDVALTGKSSRIGLVLVASTAIVLEHFVPWGGVALYPFTLLATWVHEIGHGLGALVCGGAFDKLEIYGDASGLAWTREAPGWRAAWVSAAGLIDPPLVGAIILATSRGPRRSAIVLALLATAMLVSCVLWVRTAVGILSMAPLAAILLAFALYGGPARMLFAQLVGVLLALDTVARVDYLFESTANVGGATRISDVGAIAATMGGPALVWGLALAELSFALLFLGLRAAWAPAR